LAWLTRNTGDLQLIVRGNAVLLAAGFDDCEHRSSSSVRSGRRVVPHRLLNSLILLLF
jgi:hypothetical protein